MQHDDLAILRELDIDLDELRPLSSTESEGGNGIFRRVG